LAKKKEEPQKLDHILVPEHIVLSEDQKKKVLDKYNSTLSSFPKIFDSDPALVGLGAKPGDLIRIKRKDYTSNYDYYRVVVNG
jgi:DNA-directed RNA polymerase subunit H